MSGSQPNYPSRLAEKYLVRLPDHMRDRIKAIAKANGRSMNSEIVARLEASLSSGFDAELPSREQMIAMIDLLYQKAERQPDFMGWGS